MQQENSNRNYSYYYCGGGKGSNEKFNRDEPDVFIRLNIKYFSIYRCLCLKNQVFEVFLSVTHFSAQNYSLQLFMEMKNCKKIK